MRYNHLVYQLSDGSIHGDGATLTVEMVIGKTEINGLTVTGAEWVAAANTEDAIAQATMLIPRRCDCRICTRTQQFRRFQALLPEVDRAEFEAWYSKMFDDLEALETDREMAEYHRKRLPMDMLNPTFKGLLLPQIIDRVLAEADGPLTTNELARKIYQTNTTEDFNRARNSMSHELRAGIRRSQPTWQKIGRAYAAVKQEAIA